MHISVVYVVSHLKRAFGRYEEIPLCATNTRTHRNIFLHFVTFPKLAKNRAQLPRKREMTSSRTPRRETEAALPPPPPNTFNTTTTATENTARCDDNERGPLLRTRRRIPKRTRFTQNHPPGLLALSGTEIWERFSYYTTRAVLVLYARDVIFVPIDDEGEKENFVWFAQSFAKLHGVDLRHTSDISEEERRARVNSYDPLHVR